MTDKHFLSRELIESGAIDEMVAKASPTFRILTEVERATSLTAILKDRPPGDVWLFAYGSLIWNPTINIVEQRKATIRGWRRSFCLSTKIGRGSPEKPGLVLGLDTGDSCVGIALRVAEDDVLKELTILWRREMLSDSYIPRWVELFDDDAVSFGSAITFTIDPDGEHYAGDLLADSVVERLATASGALGSSADYMFRTRDSLRAHGIHDVELEKLASSLEQAMASQKSGDTAS